MTSWEKLQEIASDFRTGSGNGNTQENIKRLQKNSLANEDRGLTTVMEGITLFTSSISEQLAASHNIDVSKITPQMREAFNLAYPNQSLSLLSQLPPSEITGYLNGWKGKYFEVLVRDELNRGHWVGDVHLASGQEAHLAALTNQPGWDLTITDTHGAVIQELQLKATNSLSYVKEALVRYPDIQVLTTDDIFDASGYVSTTFSESLLSSHISNEDLTDQITAPVEGLLNVTPLDDLLDFVPVLPFLVVALDEGRMVLMGRKTLAMALASGSERFVANGAGLAVGGAFALMDGGVFSLPAIFIVKTGVNRMFGVRRSVRELEVAIQKLQIIHL